MKDNEFKEAINKIKKMSIVKNINEPVILKHDINTGEFNRMKEKEIMKTFNNIYKGDKNYTFEDVKKELVTVEVSNYKKSDTP